MNHNTLEALQAELARQDAAFAELFGCMLQLPEDTQLALSEEWMAALEATANSVDPQALQAHWSIRA